MNVAANIIPALSVRGEFPAIAGWHYLDSAATAQKPQAVIDAITKAYDEDYATVHRGVYERSAVMTQSYENARAAVAKFIGAKSANEIVFTRNATEAINLVAQMLPKEGRKRVLLSQLEHHSNIVPWQLAGYEIDVVPITADGLIDLDAAERMISDQHRVVAFAHVSNVLGSILDAKKAADIAHSKGALLLLDGCQAAPRIPVDVTAIDCDFYALSAHKLYGPTGIGALWGRSALLDAMPPYQGGGAMIDSVTFERSTFAPPPQRFEAGTPHIVGAVGLHAAIDWVNGIGLPAIHAHESALVRECRDALRIDQQPAPVRAGGQRRHRQLRRRRGSSPRHRHHIGRRRRRHPRRPPLRPAFDGRAWGAGDGAGELRGVQRLLGHRGAGQGHHKVQRIFG